MSAHDQHENPLGNKNPQGSFYEKKMATEDAIENSEPKGRDSNWQHDLDQTIQLGQQFVSVIGGIIDLARVEAELAIRTFPKVLMLWLLMMPIILLTWCAFSALIAWAVYAASGEVGAGMLVFFVLQALLLLTCRWLYTRYRKTMTLPYTREHIDRLVRRAQHEFNGGSKAKK